jgi:hypothetical protein
VSSWRKSFVVDAGAEVVAWLLMLVRQWFVFETPDTVTVQQMYTFTSYFATLDKVSQSLDHKHHHKAML